MHFRVGNAFSVEDFRDDDPGARTVTMRAKSLAILLTLLPSQGCNCRTIGATARSRRRA